MSDRTPPQNPLQAGKHVAGNEQTEFTRSLPETQSESAKRIDLAAIIDAATDYARRGWSVIPVGLNKKPTLRAWKAQQSVRTDPKDISAWFKRLRGVAGVGIVLGEVSGGLYVRDFDDAAAYERWAAAHPDLARTLPTVKTARGFHVYARWKGVRTTKFDCGEQHEGELRSDGHYVCAPPSKHARGATYAWLVPLPDGGVPEVDPKAAGLAQAWGAGVSTCRPKEKQTVECPREAEKQRSRDAEQPEIQRPRGTRDTEAIGRVGCELEKQIDDAIEKTIPTKPGSRNRAVFNFVRELMRIPELRAVKGDLSRFKPIMRRWYQRARKFAATQDFTEYWADFTYAWSKVRLAAGEDALGKALALAESTDPPAWAAGYPPKVKLLASVCRELQRLSKPEPFFLSHRTAGNAIGEGHRTAGRWLTMFVGDGALREVKKGGPETNLATRYQYIANDL